MPSIIGQRLDRPNTNQVELTDGERDSPSQRLLDARVDVRQRRPILQGGEPSSPDNRVNLSLGLLENLGVVEACKYKVHDGRICALSSSSVHAACGPTDDVILLLAIGSRLVQRFEVFQTVKRERRTGNASILEYQSVCGLQHREQITHRLRFDILEWPTDQSLDLDIAFMSCLVECCTGEPCRQMLQDGKQVNNKGTWIRGIRTLKEEADERFNIPGIEPRLTISKHSSASVMYCANVSWCFRNLRMNPQDCRAFWQRDHMLRSSQCGQLP